MTHTPTPTAPRAITLHLTIAGEVIGEFAARLVITAPGQSTDPGSWAVTHALGSIANATHTEVAFVDGTCGNRDLAGDGSFTDPERVAIREQIVRQIADAMYARTWAFHYRPEQVPDAVLRYGSILRERVEVSTVEVWA